MEKNAKDAIKVKTTRLDLVIVQIIIVSISSYKQNDGFKVVQHDIVFLIEMQIVSTNLASAMKLYLKLYYIKIRQVADTTTT